MSKQLRASSPCRNCADRAVGCHGKCKDYTDWAVAIKEEHKGEKALMPVILGTRSFTGTSPKPGHHRRTKGSRH